MTALETKVAPRARDADATPGGGRPWHCRRCGRLLARVYGRTYETVRFDERKPGSSRGTLPAQLICPDDRCGALNVRVD